jgi:hypothetical protein
MVQIIQNPAYSGGVDTSGQRLGEALNSIASAFQPRAADIQGQIALKNERDKLAGIQTIGGAIGQSADAQQDYAQDAPDYAPGGASEGETQPPPNIDVNDPAGLGRAFMALGYKPGQALQSVSALQGGPEAPGVVIGAIPDNTVSGTPQFINQAANKPVSIGQGTRLVNPQTGATIVENPAADKEKWGVIGETEDEFGRAHKIYGYPPEKGEKTTPAPAQGEAAPADINAQLAKDGVEAIADDKTPDISLTADQKGRLTAVPPVFQGHVGAIIQGRETMPNLTGRMSPATAMLTKYVFDVNPQFDAVNNRVQVATRKSFGPSGSNNTPGVLIINGDSALDHLAALKDASDKLPNLGTVIGPTVNMAAGVTGGRLGGDYSAAKSELDTKAQVASAESIKYLAGATGGGEAERDTLRQQFSSPNPPMSRLAAMQSLAEDILKKKQELQAGWHRSMGQNALDTEVISPTSQQSLQRLGMGQWATNGQPLDPIAQKISSGLPIKQPTSGTVPQTQNIPATASIMQSAPQGPPAALPGVPSADPITAAKDAISRGAPRDAVIQRLQQNGINPAGL